MSVRESVKLSGWASLKTLWSDKAYHSFGGEVEARTPPRYAASSRQAVSNFWRYLLSGLFPPDRTIAGRLYMTARIVPFPRVRNQRFILKHAARMAGLPERTAEKLLYHLLQVQVET